MGVLLILSVIAIAFAIEASYASKMQEIAEQKGYKGRVWAWCFWLPIHGGLMVNSLPDERVIEYICKKNSDISQNALIENTDELPELQ